MKYIKYASNFIHHDIITSHKYDSNIIDFDINDCGASITKIIQFSLPRVNKYICI